MLVRTECTIIFSLPEEREICEQFRKQNDLSDWGEEQTSNCVYFYKCDNFRNDIADTPQMERSE